jgi:hypothetical protein
MDREWAVYEHVFPNGKRYIGISTDPEKRWNKGAGYRSDGQNKMHRAIKKYGWDNIEHNVILRGLTEDQAKQIEQDLIAALNTIADGYNSVAGGDTGRAFYINDFLLDRINAMRKLAPETIGDSRHYPWEAVYEDRYHTIAAQNYNRLADYVHDHYGKQEPLDGMDYYAPERFWYYFWCELENALRYSQGKKIKKIESFGENLCRRILGKQDKNTGQLNIFDYLKEEA